LAKAGINAPADRVHRIIVDWNNHQRHFLPPTFTSMVVEEDVTGTGTVI